MDLVNLIYIFENFFEDFGIVAVFLAAFIEMSPVGWILPGGVFLSIAGFFANGNKNILFIFLLTGFLGSWITLALAYILGSKTGKGFVRFFRQEKNERRANILLEKHGAIILATSMLAGFTRFWIAYAAGNQKYNFLRFSIYAAIASISYNALMIIVGFIAGTGRENLERGITQLGIISWILLVLAIVVIIWSIKKEKEALKNPT